jgi:hypothetical protein
VQGEGEHAHVAGAASLDGNALELAQQLRVVVLVGGLRARIPAGSDAREPAERLDLDPGVVGDGRQAGGSRREAGLDPGVGLEGQPILDWLAGNAELVEGDEPRSLEAQEIAQLARLVRGAGRDDEPP